MIYNSDTISYSPWNETADTGWIYVYFVNYGKQELIDEINHINTLDFVDYVSTISILNIN